MFQNQRGVHDGRIGTDLCRRLVGESERQILQSYLKILFWIPDRSDRMSLWKECARTYTVAGCWRCCGWFRQESASWDAEQLCYLSPRWKKTFSPLWVIFCQHLRTNIRLQYDLDFCLSTLSIAVAHACIELVDSEDHCGLKPWQPQLGSMHKSWLQSFCMSHCPLYQVPYSCDPLLMVCICFQVAIALHVKLRLLDVFQIGLLLAAVLEAWSPGEVHVGPPGLSQIFACLAYFSDGWIGNRRCRFLHPHRQFLKVVPIQSLERKISPTCMVAPTWCLLAKWQEFAAGADDIGDDDEVNLRGTEHSHPCIAILAILNAWEHHQHLCQGRWSEKMGR